MGKRGDAIELHGSLWMTVAGKSFGGPGRMELLSLIAERGSIAQAAKAMKMSYKAAWDAIDQMNNLAGEPLVERTVGGKGGGSTNLTQRGVQLVASFRTMEREHRRFVDQLSLHALGLDEDLHVIRRVDMKTSARNQFHGTISGIRPGAVNDEIDIDIVGGQRLAAIVTRESSVNLGLKTGAEVIALVKASSIIVVTDSRGVRFSARNQLAGTVSRVQPGAVNSEIVIDLPGGGSVAAIVTNESSQQLGLSVGAPATAIFKASSVILGVQT